ncbi:hypothetical protein M2123_002233, partial [Polynucleobacter sphagniphilus]|nr:hypothetical protein [Polynucleobacter sphagniphilus]
GHADSETGGHAHSEMTGHLPEMGGHAGLKYAPTVIPPRMPYKFNVGLHTHTELDYLANYLSELRNCEARCAASS